MYQKVGLSTISLVRHQVNRNSRPLHPVMYVESVKLVMINYESRATPKPTEGWRKDSIGSSALKCSSTAPFTRFFASQAQIPLKSLAKFHKPLIRCIRTTPEPEI